uniref:Uncharacterized protein n=1 Tax=Timema monikensis TaxID=170555 RepID=A0A7R9E4Z4_9NEOP|nr:unnamed protein product [Timema monikensis]
MWHDGVLNVLFKSACAKDAITKEAVVECAKDICGATVVKNLKISAWWNGQMKETYKRMIAVTSETEDQLNHDMENSHPSTSTSCNTDVDPGVNLLSTNPVMITEDTPVDIDLGFRDGVEEVSCSVLHLSDVNLLGNGRNLVVVSAEENVDLSGCHNLVIVPAEENVDLSKEHSHDMFNLKNVSTHFSETTDTFNLDVDIISNEIEVGNAYEDLDPDYIPSNEHESDYDYVPTEEKEQDGVIDNVKVTESEYSRNEADILPPKKKIKCDRALEKQKKDKGLEYLTRQGEIRPGRSFCFLENCCRKKCNLKIDKTKQEQIFNDFMGIGNQLTKDQILADNIVIKSKGTERKGRSITGQTKDRLGEEFKTFDLRSTKRGRPEKVQIPHIHFAPVSINPKKKKDLLSLLHLIDPLYHQFYQNLVTSSSAMLPGDWAESSDEENE